jgi:mono/diheme cytochrome c family protein
LIWVNKEDRRVIFNGFNGTVATVAVTGPGATEGIEMRAPYLMLTAIIGAVLVAPNLQAQRLSDWQRGRLLARQVCAECHAVERNQFRSRNGLAPSFTAVAATPGMSAVALNAFLHTPHRAMPDLILNDDQVRGVIAYILSLKASRSTRPGTL